MMSKQELIRLIDDEADAHLAFLSSFIRIPSPNPPGDTRAAVQFVQNYLANRGIVAEIIAPKEEAPNLVSSLRGDVEATSHPRRNLVLNGHVE